MIMTSTARRADATAAEVMIIAKGGADGGPSAGWAYREGVLVLR